MTRLPTLALVLGLHTALSAPMSAQTITPTAAPSQPSIQPNGIVKLGNTSQPRLTSVGSGLNWLQGDQTLTLHVPESGVVRIMLTSPALDPQDYRAANEYGDEHYDQNGSETVYELLNAAGQSVARRTYSADAELAKAFATDDLIHTALQAGNYTLRVTTTGRAKNTFAVSVSGGTLSAEAVNLTVLSPEWTTIAYVNPGDQGQVLRIYDTDGAQELELQLDQAQANGTHQGVAVELPQGKQNLDQIEITVTPEQGILKIQARLPNTARQHSNTIRLSAERLILTEPQPTLPAEVTPPAPATPPAVTTPEPPAQTPPPAPAPVPTPPTPPLAAPPPVSQSPATPVMVNVPLQRQSEIKVDFQASLTPESQLIVLHHLPGGASLIPGSVRVDGIQVKAVTLDASTLAVTVSSGSGTLSYQVLHQNELPELQKPSLAQYEPRFERFTPISADFPLQRYQEAQSRPAPAAQPRSSGLIRYPLDGQVLSGSSTPIDIFYEGEQPEVLVNGQVPNKSRLGKKIVTTTGGELHYYGVPLNPGKNTIQVGSETVTVQVPDTASSVRFTPRQFVADGSSPLVIDIDILDAAGLRTDAQQVTLDIKGAQPQGKDASAAQPGYQLSLTNGHGSLRLSPSTGEQLSIRALGFTQEFTARPETDASRASVGYASVTASLGRGGEISLSAEGRATAEASLAGGTLRLNADSQGGQTLSENQTPRHLSTGDAGAVEQPLTSRGPLALSYERPEFRVRYALNAAVNPLTRQVIPEDGLSLTTERGPWSLTATYARVKAGQQQQTFTALQTVLEAREAIEPGSETLTLEGTRDGVTTTKTLSRGLDYLIQYGEGNIILTHPSDLSTELSGAQYRLRYTPLGGSRPTADTASVSASYTWQGTHTGQASVGVSHDPTQGGTTFGVRVRDETSRSLLSGLVMYNGGIRAEGEVRYRSNQLSGQLRATTQSAEYGGPQKGSAATTLSGEVTYKVRSETPEAFGVSLTASGQYNSIGNSYGLTTARLHKSGFFAGAGVGYDTRLGLVAAAEAGHELPLGFRARYLQSLGGQGQALVLDASVPLTDSLALKTESRVDYNGEALSTRGSVGIGGHFGVTRYDVTYELPGASGQSGRLRSGLQADLPLDQNWSVSLRGQFGLSPTLSASASADLRYKSEQQSGQLGVDISTEPAMTYGLRSNYAATLDNFTLSEQGHSIFGVRSGHSYTLAAAYRGERDSVLGTLRYQTRLFSTKPGTDALLEYNRAFSQADLRLGMGLHAAEDFASATYHASAGGTWWLSDRVGAGVRYTLSGTLPGTGLYHAASVEGTFVPAKGFGVSAGYTFNSENNTYNKSGFYLRVDTLLRN